MDKETSEIIERHFSHTPDKLLHILLDDPVHREEVDRNPSIMKKRKIMIKSYSCNETLLLKYGDLLKNVDIEVSRYDTLDIIHRLLHAVPNVENLVISNDHNAYYGVCYTGRQVFHLRPSSLMRPYCWLKDALWDYNQYSTKKLVLAHLKILDFRMNSFAREAFRQLLRLLMDADQLDKLAICLPKEVDIKFFKKFLYNQKALTVLELQGFKLNEFFEGEIPNASFRLKMLKICGKFENIEGFSNFLTIQDQIEKVTFPCERSCVLEVILKKLKNLKTLSVSTFGIHKNTEFYEKFKKEMFKLVQLEDLSINNYNEEVFPLNDVLEMCPNVKNILMKSLNLEHGTAFNNLKKLECLSIDSFNPISFFNVKIENLKLFSCNKSTVYSEGFYWEHFLKNHPKLQSISIAFQHVTVASIVEELRVIVETLLYIENLTDFFFISESRSKTNSLRFLQNTPQHTLEVGVFPNEKVIRYNIDFQNHCPEILGILANMYDTFELRREQDFFHVMRNIRYLINL